MWVDEHEEGGKGRQVRGWGERKQGERARVMQENWKAGGRRGGSKW